MQFCWHASVSAVYSHSHRRELGVKGKVSDNTGAPIASATITIEGSDRATVSEGRIL